MSGVGLVVVCVVCLYMTTAVITTIRNLPPACDPATATKDFPLVLTILAAGCRKHLRKANSIANETTTPNPSKPVHDFASLPWLLVLAEEQHEPEIVQRDELSSHRLFRDDGVQHGTRVVLARRRAKQHLKLTDSIYTSLEEDQDSDNLERNFKDPKDHISVLSLTISFPQLAHLIVNLVLRPEEAPCCRKHHEVRLSGKRLWGKDRFR